MLARLRDGLLSATGALLIVLILAVGTTVGVRVAPGLTVVVALVVVAAMTLLAFAALGGGER